MCGSWSDGHRLSCTKVAKKKKLHTTLKLFVMGGDGIKVDLASVDLQNELRPQKAFMLVHYLLCITINN